MSKQRKWQPLQDWVLRKWQLILYTARKPFLHGFGVYSNRRGPGKNHTHRKAQSGKDRKKWWWARTQKEKTQKTQNIGVSCAVLWGGQLWSSIYLWQLLSPVRYFFFLLLWEILPGKLQRKGLGKEGFLVCAVVGRVFKSRIQQEQRCGKSLRCCIFCWEGSFPNDLWRIWFKKSALK